MDLRGTTPRDESPEKAPSGKEEDQKRKSGVYGKVGKKKVSRVNGHKRGSVRHYVQAFGDRTK